MFRARIETVTAAGAWVTCVDLGLVGPVDCIGVPVVGDAALLVRLSDTDMLLICR
jgi:hypothetical protein